MHVPQCSPEERWIVVACLQGFYDGRYLDESDETIDTVGVINLDELVVKLSQNFGGVVVIRILDFLGKTIEVYIREDISVNGIVKLVVIPSAFFFKKFSLSQGSVLILTVCQAEASAVIESAEDGSDVIDTLNRAYGSGRNRSGIISHTDELDASSNGIAFSQALCDVAQLAEGIFHHIPPISMPLSKR